MLHHLRPPLPRSRRDRRCTGTLPVEHQLQCPVFTLEDSRARLLDSLLETPLGDWGELGVTCFPLLENGRDENLGKIR